MKLFRRDGGLLVFALLAALATLVLGVISLGAAVDQPDEPITFVVEDDIQVADGALPDLNITQEAVDQAAENASLGGYEPLKVIVSGDPAPEQVDATVDDADVKLHLGDSLLADGQALPPLEVITLAEGLVADQYETRTGIVQALENSISSGHGPGAVVAAAQNATHLIHPAPNPLAWAAATGVAVSVTFFSFFGWFRRRAHRESDQRSLATARYQLARVVLDLDALEVSVHTARPNAAESQWDHVVNQVRRLQSREPELMSSVETAIPRSTAHASRRALQEFVDDAAELTVQAHALEEALAVKSGWGTAERTLRGLLGPVHEALFELTTRVEAQRPVPQRVSEELQIARDAHRSLLELTESDSTEDIVTPWQQAETDLVRAVGELVQVLRRRNGRVVMHIRDVRHHAEVSRRRRIASHARHQSDQAETSRDRLREALGLTNDEAGQAPLEVLEQANVVARARFGDHRQLDAARDDLPTAPVTEEPMRPISAPTQRQLEAEQRRRSTRRTRTRLAAVGVVIVIGFVTGGIVSVPLQEQRPEWEQAGDEQLAEITVDGDTAGIEALDEQTIRNYLRDQFTEPVRLTLAVRPVDYLDWTTNPEHHDRIRIDYAHGVETMWRLKSELDPELTDPVTADVQPPHVVLPVFVMNDSSRYVTLPAMTGTLAVGQETGLGELTFRLTDPPIWDEESGSAISYELESLSRQLNSNAVFSDRSDPQLIFWLVSTAVMLLGAVALLILRWIGQVSVGLGRWGRQAPRLHNAQQQLDRLLVDENTRDFAVAVSDTSPESAGTETAVQSLFDRLLLLCARELESLRLAPRDERGSVEFGRRVDRLVERLDVLTHQHRDTENRMAQLLRVSRDA